MAKELGTTWKKLTDALVREGVIFPPKFIDKDKYSKIYRNSWHDMTGLSATIKFDGIVPTGSGLKLFALMFDSLNDAGTLVDAKWYLKDDEKSKAQFAAIIKRQEEQE